MSIVLAHGRQNAGRGACVVSLWDLIRFHAHQYMAIARLLGDAERILDGIKPASPLPPENVADVRELFVKLARICEETGLPTTARTAEYAAAATGQRDTAAMRENVRTIRFLMEKDLSDEFIFRLPKSRAEWFLDGRPFGPAVSVAFASTDFDVELCSIHTSRGRGVRL